MKIGQSVIAVIALLTLNGCTENSIEKTAPNAHRTQSDLQNERVFIEKTEKAFQPINVNDFILQVAEIKKASPALYTKNAALYKSVIKWARDENKALYDYGLSTSSATQNANNNMHFTGYFTPIIDAKRKPDKTFRYPLYAKPKDRKKMPSRARIYAGALKNKGLEIAYTRSPIDNFFLEVQGSGYIHFIDEDQRYFFAFAGKNGYPYRSIGRILIERGEISKTGISAQAIKNWAKKQNEKTVLALLSENESAVFFEPKKEMAVSGYAGVPLIAKASVASDRNVIPTGSVLLVEMPLQDKKGRLTGEHEWRLMIALDVGSAIKGNRLDIYHGIGDDAGDEAGFYNHQGRVWLLKNE